MQFTFVLMYCIPQFRKESKNVILIKDIKQKNKLTDADDSGWENNKTNNSFTLIYVSNALPDRLAVVQELDKTIYKFV